MGRFGGQEQIYNPSLRITNLQNASSQKLKNTSFAAKGSNKIGPIKATNKQLSEPIDSNAKYNMINTPSPNKLHKHISSGINGSVS